MIMADRPIFVFIDDASFELDNFAANVAPAGEGIEFIYASTYDQADDGLAGRPAHLFILDLFGTDPGVEGRAIPPQSEILKIINDLPDLDRVYDGGAGDDSALINEYLRNLFCIVQGWRTAFEFACESVGQNRQYGLSNLGRARADHPFGAAVAYTRKGLFPDAMACFSAGFDGLFNKPAGVDEAAIAANSRAEAPGLIRAWSEIVERRLVGGCGLEAERLEIGGDAQGASRRRQLARAPWGDSGLLAGVEGALPGSPLLTLITSWQRRRMKGLK